MLLPAAVPLALVGAARGCPVLPYGCTRGVSAWLLPDRTDTKNHSWEVIFAIEKTRQRLDEDDEQDARRDLALWYPLGVGEWL